MLVDETEIVVKAGKGGNGVVAFFPGKSGPCGGNGGDGGAIYATLNPQMTSLYKYLERKEFKGNKGKPGGSNRKAGANGVDIFLPMPNGVTFINVETDEATELTTANAPLLLAKGGRGGLGNDAFKTSVFRTPKKFEEGTEGEVKRYKIIMKLIADFGLIGLPNAGKSSLLNELTAAAVKTANYPFTTLEPNLGVFEERVIADIPGLIEGASKGKGLGIKFLKHIEKVTLLIHCITCESEDLEKDYQTIRTELTTYNESLGKKNFIILLTKTDMISLDQVQEKLKILKKFSDKVYPISIYDDESLDVLKSIIVKVQKV